MAEKVIALGGEGIGSCYQCGTCTAVCPLSEYTSSNFRKTIKYVQLGLNERLLADTTPWLCYRCGDCKASCPRNANPSAIMAAVRRYQTGKYDWTGFSFRMLRSQKVQLAFVAFLSAIIVAAIWFFHGPIVLNRIDIFAFLPMTIIDEIGLVLGAIIILVLVSNLVNMVLKNNRGASQRYPSKNFAGRIKDFASILVSEVGVQKRYEHCENKNRRIAHLSLFWGFVGLLVATLLDFSVDKFGLQLTWLVPRGLGIASGLALTYGALFFIYKRVKKDEDAFSVSYHAEWTFVILLLLAGVTGFLIDAFKLFVLSFPTYVTFTIHIAIVLDLLVLSPFSQFAHAMYRPIALYLDVPRQEDSQKKTGEKL